VRAWRAADDQQATGALGGLKHQFGAACESAAWSTRPHRAAVSASSAVPDKARYSVRHGPILRGMLTVPPAPGIRPMATSGSRNVVPGRAMTRPANAEISMPAPTQAP
jgi:hypothetical protein